MENETAVTERKREEEKEKEIMKKEKRERCGKEGRMIIIPSMHVQLICYLSRTCMSLPSASSSLP